MQTKLEQIMKNNLYRTKIEKDILYISNNNSVSLPMKAIIEIEETKNCFLIHTKNIMITIWKETSLIYTTIME